MTVVDQPVMPHTQERQETIAVTNPVTGKVIDHVPVRTAEEVRLAAERARAAQPAWEALGVKERCRLLKRWSNRVWAEQTAVMGTIRAETGKVEMGAWEEVAVTDNTTDYYVYRAPGILRPQTRRGYIPFKHRARIYYKPYGVVGFITPWNYPLLNGFQDVIPALIAGNTALVKPSEYTPYTAIHVVDLMYSVGIPRDVIQVLTGDRRTGAAVLEVADCISFTGSTAVGRQIARRAGERLIPCSLELGGKDPMIVLKDANLELAASGMLAAGLENAGQACVSVERVYVEDGIYDRFIERVRHYANQIVLGAGDGLGIHVGSLTNERELLRTEAQIHDAVSKGAKVLHGGRRRPDLGPLFHEPTVLTDVDHSMVVMQEESFGPIIPIMRVKDADEAIRLANDNPYGLSASIYSSDLRRAEQLATRIESGDVSINCPNWIFGTPSLPMGGTKESGVGQRQGPEGILRFVRPQSILIDNLLAKTPSLTVGDPLAMKAFMLIRRLRPFLPFLRQ